MPYKLVNCWSKACVRLFALASLFLSIPALATLTVTPAPPYSYSASSVVYFAAPSADPVGDPNLLDTAIGFKEFSVSAVRTNDSAGRPNLIFFDVSTDRTAADLGKTDTNVLVLMLTSTTGTEKTVPFAAAGPTTCSGTSCDCNPPNNCYYESPGNVSTNAAIFTPGLTLRVGVYIAEICAAASASPPAGCDGSTPRVNGTTIPIKFSIVAVPLAVNNAVDLPDASGAESVQISVSFQNDRPTLSCSSVPNNFYFPGDGEILVEPASFSGIGSAVKSDLDTAIIVGKIDNAEPVKSATFGDPGVNDIVGRVPLQGGTTSVGGFVNTVTGAENKYRLDITVRDKAGILAPFNGTCNVSGVQSADIQGFLARSNCFIATAAYRSTEAYPVRMLREFRDRILLQFNLGREFVGWYYAWSPSAAEWLMRNPEYRYPVLVALLPLEIVAWACLNPAWAMVLGLLACAGIAAMVRWRARKRRCLLEA